MSSKIDWKGTVMYQIPEIQLLPGPHSDTGRTGRGCFMNVVAYLNGDAQITDSSECVCPVVRPIAIWLNDFYTKRFPHERGRRLLPFVLRALGSRTDDSVEVSRRIGLAVRFAELQRDIAAECVERAKPDAELSAEFAAKYAAMYARSAVESAEHAAEHAARTAKQAEHAAAHVALRTARTATEERILQVGLDFMDEALPQVDEVQEQTIARAQELKRLSECSKL